MAKNSPKNNKRIDPSLIKIYDIFRKEGKCKSFPEFSRMIASNMKIKENKLRFFK